MLLPGRFPRKKKAFWTIFLSATPKKTQILFLALDQFAAYIGPKN